MENCLILEENNFLPKNRKEWIIQVLLMLGIAGIIDALGPVEVTVIKRKPD